MGNIGRGLRAGERRIGWRLFILATVCLCVLAVVMSQPAGSHPATDVEAPSVAGTDQSGPPCSEAVNQPCKRNFQGQATDAWLWNPRGIALDPLWTGPGHRVFFADSNLALRDGEPDINSGSGGRFPQVRAFSVDGPIRTIAGPGEGSAPTLGSYQRQPDGSFLPPARAQDSRISGLYSVAFDREGTAYIGTDEYVVKLARGNIGDPSNDFSGEIGYRVAEVPWEIRGLAFDKKGGLFLAERYRIWRVDPGPNGTIDPLDPRDNRTDSTETMSIVAGTNSPTAPGAYSGDDVPATASNINAPHGISFDQHGNLLIADTCNQRIRSVSAGADGIVKGDADEVITTLAGRGISTGGGAGFMGCSTSQGGANFNEQEREDNEHSHPLAAEADFNMPTSVVEDRAGNLLVADFFNNRIRRIYFDSQGQRRVETVAGCGPVRKLSGGVPRDCPTPDRGQRLVRPYGLALGPCPEGDLFVSEHGWTIDPQNPQIQEGNRIRRLRGVASCGGADLSIVSFLAEKSGVVVGERVPLSIVATNAGPEAARAVKLSVTNKTFLPVSYESPRLEGQEGTCQTMTGGGVSCSLTNPLPPQASVTLKLSALPLAPGDLVSRARIENAAPVDHVDANNVKDLAVRVALPPQPADPIPCLVACGSGEGGSPTNPPPGSTPPGAGPVDTNQSSITVTTPPGGPASAAPSTVPVSSPASQPFGQQVPLTGSLGFQPGPASATAPASAPTVPELIGAGAPAAAASALADASDEQQSDPAPRYSMVSHEIALQAGVSLTAAVLLAGLACMFVVRPLPSRAAPAPGWGTGSKASTPGTRPAV